MYLLSGGGETIVAVLIPLKGCLGFEVDFFLIPSSALTILLRISFGEGWEGLVGDVGGGGEIRMRFSSPESGGAEKYKGDIVIGKDCNGAVVVAAVVWGLGSNAGVEGKGCVVFEGSVGVALAATVFIL